MLKKIGNATYKEHEWLLELAEAPGIPKALRVAAGGKAAQQLLEHRYFMDIYRNINNEKLPSEVRMTMKQAGEAVLSRDTDSELKFANPKKFETVLKNRGLSPSAVREFKNDLFLANAVWQLNLRKN
ncbi:MAG: hypothetical protein NTV88_05170 [Candidatus Micrarchaeota archaeon]|nr:hypothetical protein [Candidatus Micrarchaeota archaeon]